MSSYPQPVGMREFESDRENLLQLLASKSVFRGHFVLSSGAESDLYVDAKLTTLDPSGAILVGRVGWHIIKNRQSMVGRIASIGGLTMGADPIALSIGIASRFEDATSDIQTFTVRKKAKEHGRHKHIEGNFRSGDLVVVVDDVVTTGGSTIQAIEAVEEAKARVAFVLVLVDRQEGGRQRIEELGHEVVPIFTREEILSAHGNRQARWQAA